MRRAWALRDVWRPELTEEIVPIFDPERFEYSALGGGRPGCSGSITDAAVLANFSHVGLRNPTGSGLLLVLETIWVEHAAAIIYELFFRAVGAVDTTQACFTRDTRFGATQNEPILFSTLTAVAQAGIGPIGRFVSNVIETRSWAFELALLPGFEMFVTTNAANNAVAIQNFIYRARPISDEEISVR